MKNICIAILILFIFQHSYSQEKYPTYIAKYTFVGAPLIPDYLIADENKFSSDTNNFKSIIKIDTIDIEKNKKKIFIRDFTLITNKDYGYIFFDSVRRSNFTPFNDIGEEEIFINRKKNLIYFLKTKKFGELQDADYNNSNIVEMNDSNNIHAICFYKAGDSVRITFDKQLPSSILGMLSIKDSVGSLVKLENNTFSYYLNNYATISDYNFNSIKKRAKRICKRVRGTKYDWLFPNNE